MGTDKNNKHSEIIKSILSKLTVSLDFNELIQSILNVTLEMFGGKTGSIMIIENNIDDSDENKEIVIKASKGLSTEIISQSKHKIGDGISGKVVKTKKPLLLFGKPDSNDFQTEKKENFPKSSMIIPLLSDDEVIGVLNINDKKDDSLFSNEDLDLIMSISNEIGRSIRNSMVYNETIKNLKILNEVLKVTETMKSSKGLNYILKNVMNSAEKIMKAEASTVFILDKETNKLIFKFVTGPKTETIRDMSLEIGEGIAGYVAKTRKSIIVNDPYNNERFFKKIDDMSEYKTRNAICAPLIADDEIIGVLEIINKIGDSKKGFDEFDMKMLETFAAEAAIAITNNLLFDKLEKEKNYVNKILEIIPSGILVLDKNFIAVSVNESFCRIFNCDEINIKDKKINEILDPEILTNTGIMDSMLEILNKEGEKDFKNIKFSKNIEKVLNIKIINLKHKDNPHILISVNDVTDEYKQNIKDRFLATIVKRTEDAIISVDVENKITSWNPGAGKLFSYEDIEIIGKPIFELLPENKKEEADKLHKWLMKKVYIKNFETFGKDKFGREFPALLTTSALYDEKNDYSGYCVIVRDITEIRKNENEISNLEKQLFQAEKLSAIGQLVAGVAHELNNPLTAIMGYADLLLQDKNINDNIKEDMKVIHDNAVRSKNIVQNLLSFARKNELKKETVNINNIIDEVLKIKLKQMEINNIKVEKYFSENIPETVIDKNQILQVLLNIVNNAHYVLKKFQQNGILKIKTDYLAEQKIILTEITDNGPGISEEMQKHIFDPFFTTKPVGEGTGLGLSISYGIIKKHGGKIYFKSKLGEGTSFFIELPKLEAGEEMLLRRAAEIETVRNLGQRKILVIDDEQDIRNLLSRFLTKQEFIVDEAASGDIGMEKIRINDYDLILLDMKMPGNLNGQMVYELIKKEKPKIIKKVVFITGSALGSETLKYFEEIKCPFITKPFNLSDLKKTIATYISS